MVMSRNSPLFFVQLQGDLINTVTVDTDRSGTGVVTLGYGDTWSLRPQEVLVGGVFYVLVWVSVLL
jgi:hypothetical protein